MAIKYIIVLFVETPRKFIYISTDEDPGLRIESSAVINLRGVSTNKTIMHVYYNTNFHCIHAIYKLNLHGSTVSDSNAKHMT